MSINGVDLLVAVVVAVPMATGIKDGLISGLLRAGALVLACGLAVWKMGTLAAWATSTAGIPASAAPVAVLASGLALGWVVGGLCGWIWRKVSAGSIGWADRLAGGCAGAIKGLLVALVVVAAASLVSPAFRASARSSWTGSHTGPLLDKSRSWLDARLRSRGTVP
jgi:uncharacterized membrane protein required for colicin V production